MKMPTALTAATIGAAAVLAGGPATAAEVAPAPAQTTVDLHADNAVGRAANTSKAARKKAKRIEAAKRADSARTSLVRVALRQKGDRYVAGHSGPGAFDCSGFTKYVYKKAADKNLPHYSGAQMKRAKRVSTKNLKPGDLLFFGPGGSQHVSMYIGKGKMIHATNPRSGVRVDSIHMGYYKARFAGAGRIINV